MTQAPSFYAGFLQPESAANTDYQPQYPFDNVTQTRSGHMFELDDTKDRERVRLQHRTGTFIEMQPNGDEVHKVYGDGYEITVKDKHISISGKCVVEILGDANIHIAGDKTETVDGSVVQHIKGNYSQIVEGISSITSQGNMSVTAGSGVTGKLSIKTGSTVSLDSDLRVRGEISGDKIFSFGRIDTSPTGGISAGIQGFVTALGGISVGVPAVTPIAVPGNILCVGTINAGLLINAGVSMNAPVGNFGLMSAGLMTDTVNTSIYDSHVHIGNRGFPTSPPLSPMV